MTDDELVEKYMRGKIGGALEDDATWADLKNTNAYKQALDMVTQARQEGREEGLQRAIEITVNEGKKGHNIHQVLRLLKIEANDTSR